VNANHVVIANKFEEEVNHPKKFIQKQSTNLTKLLEKYGLKKKIIAYVKDEIPPTLTNLINDNYGVVLKLSLLAFNKKKRFLKVLESFISFIKKYDAKKPIICFFMLNLRFKSLCFISSYIVYEGVAIVEKYDNRSLHPMFIKCHDHLHLVLKSKVDCANPTIEKIHSLDILKQTTNTN
jgi:hypothetical protein